MAAKVQSLKDQNRWPLWFAITANVLVFYLVMNAQAVASLDYKRLVSATASLLPAGLTILFVTLLNGLLSSQIKARLVFLRWQNALPGHRAFSLHAKTDSRIDLARLKKACGNKVPVDPAAQNALWYRWLKTTEKEEIIAQAHRDYLLMRDYTALSALFLLFFGVAVFVMLGRHGTSWFYAAALLGQFVLVRQSAATYGVRLVQNVMARKAA